MFCKMKPSERPIIGGTVSVNPNVSLDQKKNDIKERLTNVFSEQFDEGGNLKNDILATVDKSITLKNIDHPIDTYLSNTIKMQLLDDVLNKHLVAIDDIEKKNIIKYAGFNSMQPTHIWFESSHSLENFDLFLKGLDLMIRDKKSNKEIQNEHTLKVKTEDNKIKIEDYKFKYQEYCDSKYYGFYTGKASKENIKHGNLTIDHSKRNKQNSKTIYYVGEVKNGEYSKGTLTLDNFEIKILSLTGSNNWDPTYNGEVKIKEDATKWGFQMKQGESYSGPIKKGNLVDMFSFEGVGTYTFANGATYNGNWENNKPHRDGTLTLTNGTIIKGNWEEGQLISTSNTEHANYLKKSIRQIVNENPVVQEVKTVQVVGEIAFESPLSDGMDRVCSSIHSTVNFEVKTLSNPLINCF